LAQNSKGLAFDFIEKYLFTTKTGQKSVFHLCETCILSQLDITVLYTIFLVFEKYRVLTQNPMELAIGFTDEHLSMAKMGRKSISHPR
jgi:hypothetical protein